MIESFPTGVVEGEVFNVNDTSVTALKPHNLNKAVEAFRIERATNQTGPDYVKWLLTNGYVKLSK